MKASAEVSATRHTPGPWEVGSYRGQGRGIYHVHAEVIAGKEPVHICYTFDPDHDQSLSNAHLIAAAPDLSAFVRKSYAGMAFCICGGMDLKTDLECTKCVAEKLISKAEGRSQ